MPSPAPSPARRQLCTLIAVLIWLSGCVPESPSDFSHYGKPIEVPKATVKEVWADFAHECDWRVFGPGRVREKASDGSYMWRQVHVPSLQDQYAQMRTSKLWASLKAEIYAARSDGVEFLLEQWTGMKSGPAQQAWIRNDAHLQNDERDLVPLLLLELSTDDKDHVVSAPSGGVLEDYCKPGRMAQVIDHLLKQAAK